MIKFTVADILSLYSRLRLDASLTDIRYLTICQSVLSTHVWHILSETNMLFSAHSEENNGHNSAAFCVGDVD